MLITKDITRQLRCSAVLLLVVFFCNEGFLFAQNISVSGKVKDKRTAAALQQASVALYTSTDSSLVSGDVTKSDGSFAITNIQEGSYYITITLISYQPQTVSSIRYEGKNIALGSIALKQADNNLRSVTIAGKQKDMNQTLDKQTYKAALFLNAKGATALDVLKNLPSVSVNGLGDISLRGTDGIQVLVNGKQMRGDISDILSQLPANSIENIELITAPSAKFDADDKAGVINFITKKETANGLFTTLNIQGGLPSVHDYDNHVSPARFGGDATLSYNKKKWNISAALSYLRNDAAGYREGDVYTIFGDTLTKFPSNGERSFKRKNYSARTSLAFTPNKNNTFSVGLYAGRKFQARTADLLYNNSKTHLTDNSIFQQYTYFNSNLQTKEANIYLGNADYTHSFQNKSAITASFLYEYDDLYGNTKNLNQYYPQTVDTIQFTRNTNTNPLHGYKALLSYNYNIGKLKMESGYQYRNDNQQGNFIYATNVLHTKEYVVDPAFTSGVKTNDGIQAVYTQLSGSSETLQYTAGLRYEYSRRILSFSNNVLPGNTLRLSNLFPSTNVLYSLPKNWKVKAAFSRRIQRTTNFELNPFPEREHSETLEQGDPNLLPTFTSLAELGIIRDFTNGSLFITAYYQHTKDPVQRLNSIYNDTILNRIYTNAGKANQWGTEAGITAKPAKWLQLYIGGNVYDYHISGVLFNNAIDFSNHGWVYSFNANLGFTFSSTVTMQLSTNYTSRIITAQGTNSSFFSPNLSLRKTFLQGRLNSTLQWQNIDLGTHVSNRQRITTSGYHFYTTTNYIVEPDLFLFNLGLTLKQNNKKIKLPASEFGEKEF